MVSSPEHRRHSLGIDLAMTDRPNETSGTTPPRPDDGMVAAAPAVDDRTPAGHPAEARRADAPHRGGFGWIVVIALILGGVAASPWWAPEIAPLLPWAAGTVPAPAPQADADAANRRLDELGRRLADAEQRLVQLGQRPTADGAVRDAALAPLRDAIQRQESGIAGLANRTAALEQRPVAPPTDPAILADLQSATAKLGAALATLEQRVGALASANASDAAASIDPALLLSLGQLHQALQGSGPFAAELGAATALASGHADVRAALAPLAESAARGVPSLAILRQRFDGLAGSIADAGTGAAAPDDWSGQVLGKLRSLVTVRRVGPAASGDGPEAAVAQAESALARDDLAGAVAALEALHGPAMVAAREWLETARRRLAVEAAFGKATTLVTARLTANRKPAAADGAGAKP
jgi:hypothetical protein